ncbi:double zinc ribbon domain-containing protein [Candidatus Nitrosocosmicus franklandus]|uniref:double zinc ribbon domain-containing protein n=1 Tax=Candidatus Nitrosocosmicus franklandianus TaxID=1798806 RepID=UPI0010695E6A
MKSNKDDTSNICLICKKDNPTGAKFCSKCGTRFPLKCPHCNNSNNFLGAVYCNECGL